MKFKVLLLVFLFVSPVFGQYDGNVEEFVEYAKKWRKTSTADGEFITFAILGLNKKEAESNVLEKNVQASSFGVLQYKSILDSSGEGHSIFVVEGLESKSKCNSSDSRLRKGISMVNNRIINGAKICSADGEWAYLIIEENDVSFLVSQILNHKVVYVNEYSFLTNGFLEAYKESESFKSVFGK